MMRVIILVLCCFIIFFNNANAGVIYKCIDSDGNLTFTDMPQDGMKCDLKSDDINSVTATNKFVMKAREFLKPKTGVEDFDVTVEITHEKGNFYNVIVMFNQNAKTFHKVDAEEAFFFYGYVVKYFGLSKGFSGFSIHGTKYGKNEIKYSLVLNKTGNNLKQNDYFNSNIRPEFILSGK